MLELFIRLLSALWNALGILLVIVVATELGVDAIRGASRRLRYGKGGKPDAAAISDAYAGTDWSAAYYQEVGRRLRFDWSPLDLWRHRPCRGTYLNVDAHGRRVTPGADRARADAVKVVCFGGSTLFGLGARDEWTIPAALQRLLDETGHGVAVANCGQCGYVRSQELAALIEMLKRGEPIGIAIFYDGFNDLAVAEWTGRTDLILGWEARASEFGLFSPERRGDLIRAGIVAVLPRTLRRLRRLTGLPLRGPVPRLERGRLADEKIAPLAAAVCEAYSAHVRMVRQLAQAYGFQPLFVRQPFLATKKTKSADEENWDRYWTRDKEARRRLTVAFSDACQHHPDLRAAGDVVDLSAVFDTEARPMYVDFCHLSEAANVAVAEALLPTVERAVAALERKEARVASTS